MAAAASTTSHESSGIVGAPTIPAFPAGSWTLYFHDPEDSSWTTSSYKVLAVIRSWEDLWCTFKTIDNDHFHTGMYFFMKDPFTPLWEASSNIKGGSYQIKVFETESRETYERYCAAAILQIVATNPANLIKGVSISLKKKHHIIKLWNDNAKMFNKESDIALLGDKTSTSDIIYIQNLKKQF